MAVGDNEVHEGAATKEASMWRNDYTPIARALHYLPYYEQHVGKSFYVNHKLLRGLKSELNRDFLESGQQTPLLPEGGLDPTPEAAADFAAEWMLRDLENMGEQETADIIRDCGFSYKKLAENPEVKGPDGADGLMDQLEQELQLTAVRYTGQVVDPNLIVSEATNGVITKGRFDNPDGVKEDFGKFVNSYIELLKKADWWNRVINYVNQTA